MKATYYKINISLFVLCSLLFFSCDKSEDIELIDPSFKTFTMSCGYDFEVPILADNWKIESVKDVSSGQDLLDKDGNLLSLDGDGQVEASNGWLSLTRASKDKFSIHLKENFDKSRERSFTICINEAGQRDYVTVIQQAGSEYQLVKAEYTEIETERSIYVSDKECTNIRLNNPLPTEVWEPTGWIYEQVMESSFFESDDYGAFDWISEEKNQISVPELIIDNSIRWGRTCTYKEGVTTTPYIKDIPNGNKILMPPYSTLYLKGEITYCKRVCLYTFTIQNMDSGTRFEVKGLWTQIVPISSGITSSDKKFLD